MIPTPPAQPSPHPRSYGARIVGIDDVMQDTRILHMELDNRQPLVFTAGQYARLSAAGLDARPFSIASRPQAATLEFHVRDSGQGISSHLVRQAKPGDKINLEGPFGQSHWRPSPRPLLALAGGLGIAPIKAIVEAHLEETGHSPLRLYWGVRDETQLYLDGHFRDLARKHGGFSYIPVLSSAAGPDAAARFRTGFIAECLQEDFPGLEGLNIYMAGPPPMIDATRPRLLQQGAEAEYLFGDAWNP